MWKKLAIWLNSWQLKFTDWCRLLVRYFIRVKILFFTGCIVVVVFIGIAVMWLFITFKIQVPSLMIWEDVASITESLRNAPSDPLILGSWERYNDITSLLVQYAIQNTREYFAGNPQSLLSPEVIERQVLLCMTETVEKNLARFIVYLADIVEFENLHLIIANMDEEQRKNLISIFVTSAEQKMVSLGLLDDFIEDLMSLL